MFMIKSALKVSVLSVSLFALVGCGDSSCCDGVSSATGVKQDQTTTAVIGENGGVATLAPSSNTSTALISPTAHITINGEDTELAKLKLFVDNNFSAIGSNDPDGQTLTYKWTGLGNQDLGTALSFDKKFCNKGLYKVGLEVTDEHNLTGTDSVCILVGLDEMPLVVEVSENQTVAQGESVTLSATVVCQDDDTFDYKWTENGVEISTDASFSTSDLSVGEHTFKVVVKDANGKCTAKYITVTVK